MPIDPKLLDVTLPPSGYPEEVSREDTRENLMSAVSESGGVITDFPNSMWIERKDWGEVSRYLKETRTRAVDYLDRFTHQGNSHECTCHALRACMESARNRARRISLGPPEAGKRLEISAKSASVWLSPLSVYAEANPRQWGGAGVRQVLRIAVKRGMLPDPIQPRPWKFKHKLHSTIGPTSINQTGGGWASLRNFPEGWQETAKHFKPVEFIFPETWEQSVCLVLNSLMLGVGRDGHSIPYGEWIDDEEVMAYPDSYDLVRYDSVRRIKATVGDSYAVVSVKTPDDWEKPAGE